MEFYRVTYHTYLNGECIYTNRRATCLRAEEPQPEVIHFTWDNVDELHSKYYSVLPAYLDKKKKGAVLNFYQFGLTGKKIKSWKVPNLDLRIEIKYECFVPTISWILDYYDAKSAVAYIAQLHEQGSKIAQKLIDNY